MVSCVLDFSRALNKSQLISKFCDWLVSLFAPIVIVRSHYLGIGFRHLYNYFPTSHILSNDENNTVN